MSRNERRRNRSKKRTFFKVFTFSIVIFAILGLGIMYGFSLLNKVDSIKIPKNNEELGIKDGVMDNTDVLNIALFGLDEPGNNNSGRTDSIMIASLDKVHKKIKLTSIMRDTYVYIPDHGMDKINHAHAFGGPELAIKTINQNFDTNIREFAAVDFFGLEKIIDILGGVQVDVKPNEINYINKGVLNMNGMDGTKGAKVTDSGYQTLTGRQAVAYSRIRKTGDGDFERTQRQRLILEQVINKGLNAGIGKYPELMNSALPFVKTSLSKKEMLSIGTFVLRSGINTVDKFRLPLNDYLLEQRINGISYIVPNTLEDNVAALKAYIYDDIKIKDDSN